ncbi:MAG: hypothetical protein A2Z25_00320 [Planctomycetes bacterium RBG_16_55_9]|nr:MAG: hypothetical protein A2Z25_00320 [Planctomycetes bacterium RBG_16_55_9]
MSSLRRYEYLLSFLPSLEPIGSIPPMSKSAFLEHVIESKGPVHTVEMLLLSDDLMQYQALLAEEVEKDRIDLAILSLDKGEDEAVLPDFLLPDEKSEAAEEGKENERLPIDAIWARYFRHAASVAKREPSRFLKDWVGFEVGLRNALVTARSRKLDLDPAAYLVAPELGDKDVDYSHVISAWSSAADPQMAMEVLDRARWDWLEEHGGWFSFSTREIEAYAAKLVLLHRWRRIRSEKRDNKVNAT